MPGICALQSSTAVSPTPAIRPERPDNRESRLSFDPGARAIWRFAARPLPPFKFRLNAPDNVHAFRASAGNLAQPAARRAERSTKGATISCRRRWRRYCFSEGGDSSARSSRGRGRGYGGGAKRNGVQGIENNQFREMRHFAPLMISRAYACVAKSFASPCEMNPSASPGCARRRRPRTRFANARDGIVHSAAQKGGRRSQMAP